MQDNREGCHILPGLLGLSVSTSTLRSFRWLLLLGAQVSLGTELGTILKDAVMSWNAG